MVPEWGLHLAYFAYFFPIACMATYASWRSLKAEILSCEINQQVPPLLSPPTIHSLAAFSTSWQLIDLTYCTLLSNTPQDWPNHHLKLRIVDSFRDRLTSPLLLWAERGASAITRLLYKGLYWHFLLHLLSFFDTGHMSSRKTSRRAHNLRALEHSPPIAPLSALV